MFFLENLLFRVALKYNIRLDLSIIAEKESGISFGSFPHSWEQRKLGELCNITTGKLDANAMVSDGQYDFYISSRVDFKQVPTGNALPNPHLCSQAPE